MSKSYFPGSKWPAFVYQGTSYDLSPLDEYQIGVVDSGEIQRRIAVTFSAHCFTRKPEPADDSALHYPHSPENRHFCIERYQLSSSLVSHIAHAAGGKVWILDRHRGMRLAIIPTVLHKSIKMFYGIVFDLERVKGLPVDLRMRVITAYPCGENVFVTYGAVGFSRLVTMRIQNKNLKPDTRPRRSRPRLS